MTEKKTQTTTDNDNSAKKQIKMALIVLAVFEAIVMFATIFYKLSK